MRRVVVVSVTLAVTLSLTVGAVGQQEFRLVDLSVEPERMERSISLFDAAVANDFAAFDSIYREAPQPEYAELHRLWTWSMNDPVGAFYGDETYQRLASLYPGFVNYMAAYQIVDSNGNTFYPTAETRRFLLRQAVYGVVGRLQIASEPAPKPVPAPKPEVKSAVIAEVPAVVAAPAVAAPAPAVAAPAPRVAPAPVVADDGVRGVVRQNEATRGALSRNIFLIIAGLIGIGLMTLMLQTPQEKSAR